MTKAITKVEECRGDIQVAEKCITELTPTLTAAKNVLKKSEDNVMNATKDYRDAKQACNDHQQKIESLERPLLKLRQEVQQDFSLVCRVQLSQMQFSMKLILVMIAQSVC